MDTIRFSFLHGLGDSSNFAHALPLWVRRGYTVEIHCPKDKAILFEPAGATWVESATVDNVYGHPADLHQRPQFDGVHQANKLGYNLVQPWLPQIGEHTDLWREMLNVKLTLPEPETKKEIDDWLDSMQGKVVCFHPMGNTGPEQKNLSLDTQAETCRELLDQTDATIVLLDWDNRTQKISNRRVRHMADDFRKLNVLELAYLIGRSALFIGVDSGPLHLTRFTDTPVLGVWTGHHPARYALPRTQTAHLVPGIPLNKNANRYNRHTFNLIESTGAYVTGQDIAKHATRALAGRIGADLAIAALVDKVRTTTARDDFKDRNKTFGLALAHLAGKLSPQVIETGCIRSEDDWTAGFFGYVFGWHLATNGGKLDSVDLNPANVNFAKKWTGQFPVTVHHSDSLKWLGNYTGPKIDLAYLDSLDTDARGHAEHCLQEAKLVLPHLAEDGLILIDDTPKKDWGKGRLAVPFVLNHGFRVKYWGYQVLLEKVKA